MCNNHCKNLKKQKIVKIEWYSLLLLYQLIRVAENYYINYYSLRAAKKKVKFSVLVFGIFD
jgi:hypothetical protein